MHAATACSSMARSQAKLSDFFAQGGDSVSNGKCHDNELKLVIYVTHAVTESAADKELPTTSSLSGAEQEELSTQCPCVCPCCTISGPPIDVKDSKQSYSHHSEKLKKTKTYSRSLQTSWYEKYPWISVCTTRYRIFCHACRSAKHENLLVFSKRQLNCFIEDGFYNWKNALAKLDEHEKSEMHREAVIKLAAKASSTNVGAQLNARHLLDQKHHQRMLSKLLSTIRFLARQGLALRGHHEDIDSLDGNLYKLLLLRAEDCPQLKSWVQRKEYTSPEIVNEIINLMGNTVLREILGLIKTSMWFSIIADEATDVSRNEQMSLSIRWIDDSYKIYEEPTGLVQLPDTKARTIYSVIKDLLIRCSLPVSVQRPSVRWCGEYEWH